MSAAVRLTNVKKAYGVVEVLHGVDLDIQSGEFVVFVGPSGCGKSTLLRLIAGLEDITSGDLEIGGVRVNAVQPSKRGIAMVFQSYALYPHMTVYDNMAFGLKLGKAGKDAIDARVREAAEMLQITRYLDRLPRELSGGQRQRVAIGRAIVRNPRVFLFDEPLSNLDAALRVATRLEIANLHERMADTTMIYVTHDQVEAMTLADRIVVLNYGVVEQVGAPMQLYHRPDNLFVARFIGSPAMNIVKARVTAGGPQARVELVTGPVAEVDASVPLEAVGAEATFGVRPEDLIPTNGSGLFTGKVAVVEKLGEVTLAYLDIGLADPLTVKIDGDYDVVRGSKLTVTSSLESRHLFDGEDRAFTRSPL
jgi:ABC-type sugar transport system ATPase subunit